MKKSSSYVMKLPYCATVSGSHRTAGRADDGQDHRHDGWAFLNQRFPDKENKPGEVILEVRT